MYRCEARNLSDFIRQLAVNYIARGYFFCVKGVIPEHKDPTKTDEKIIGQYGIAISKWTRARQKKQGTAGVQYLRHGREFVIAATHGEHRFFAEEPHIQDVRREPLKVSIYSIGYNELGERGHVSVRIERDAYKALKNHLEERALCSSQAEICAQIGRVQIDSYAPIRTQVWSLLRAINRRRKLAGQETISQPVTSWHQKRS